VEIVQYPHPTLRHRSKPLKRVDAEVRAMVKKMFELMYEARGVGLAANQVDLPIRLFVVNTKGDPEEGEEMVFINPVVSLPKGLEEAEEGCLSLPKLYGDVKRPKQVKVQAYGLDGREYTAVVDGLLARVIQHELDHLDGVLFVDRLSETGKMAVQDELQEFKERFEVQRKSGMIPQDEEIARRLVELEAKYC
jgi:peptide deformylase